jgi:hypothetical protein
LEILRVFGYVFEMGGVRLVELELGEMTHLTWTMRSALHLCMND